MVDLNNNLMPENSPIAQNQGQTSAFAFDYQNEPGVISARKIKNFSFDQAQGGTITLGGMNNGNGVMQVNDSSGSALIIANNNGIVIKGTAGTTILDEIGLVSQSSFHSDTLINTDTHITTSISYIDVPGGSLQPFSLLRQTKVFMYLDITAGNYDNYNDVNHFCYFNLTDGTTYHISQQAFPQYLFQGGTALAMIPQEQVQIVIVNLNAGTYTLKVQQRAVNGGTCSLEYLRCGYVILGN